MIFPRFGQNKCARLKLGYRTTIKDKFYVDAGAYYSWYKHFIGYNLGLDIGFDPIFTEAINSIDVYRYAANSINEVQTQGASIGLQYYLNNHITFSGNYSWNKLIKTDIDDPIIPAFNTPEHKYNLGINIRDLDAVGKISLDLGLIISGFNNLFLKAPSIYRDHTFLWIVGWSSKLIC